MTLAARQAAPLRPAAVSIHDDGKMLRQFVHDISVHSRLHPLAGSDVPAGALPPEHRVQISMISFSLAEALASALAT